MLCSVQKIKKLSNSSVVSYSLSLCTTYKDFLNVVRMLVLLLFN